MTHCETCNGTGYVVMGYVVLGRPPKRFICTDCDGRGEIHLVPKDSYQVILALERKAIKK